MVAFMRAVEMEAREKSCWKNNNREWTNEYVRNMIDEIRGDFTKKYTLGNNCLRLVHSEQQRQQREQEKKSSR